MPDDEGLLRESVWKRAGGNTKQVILNSVHFWVFSLVWAFVLSIAAVGFYPEHASQLQQSLIQGAFLVTGFLGASLAIWIASLVRAPYWQRHELRERVLQLKGEENPLFLEAPPKVLKLQPNSSENRGYSVALKNTSNHLTLKSVRLILRNSEPDIIDGFGKNVSIMTNRGPDEAQLYPGERAQFVVGGIAEPYYNSKPHFSFNLHSFGAVIQFDPDIEYRINLTMNAEDIPAKDACIYMRLVEDDNVSVYTKGIV